MTENNFTYTELKRLSQLAYKPDPEDMVGITYDDVLITPNFSDIESRAEIDTSTYFFGSFMNIPIISSNMDYITGPEMVQAMFNAGGLGILHRFAPWEEQLEWMESLDKDNVPFIFSVGIRDIQESVKRIDIVKGSFPNALGVCIDVAHGYHQKVEKLIKSSKDAIPEFGIIAGNIANAEGAEYLVNAGADILKVGIGSGSVCTTRLVAGIGVPQLSAILDVADIALPAGVGVIADGGIRGSADMMKAFAAGASYVMLGSLLAGATECPSPVVIGSDGRKYRPFRGQSIFGTNGERYVKEGVEGYVEDKGPVKDIIENLRRALQSGMSYVGARNMAELFARSQFVVVSQHTQHENAPRVRTQI